MLVMANNTNNNVSSDFRINFNFGVSNELRKFLQRYSLKREIKTSAKLFY